MRLFVAIEIPKEIREALACLLEEFRVIAPGVKWIRAKNLHITLKFLGETEDSKLPSIIGALAKIHIAEPVALSLCELSLFPNYKRPKILWAGIRSSLNLQELVKTLDLQLNSLGFPPEDRAFTPHITLARLERTELPRQLASAIVEKARRKFGDFTATEFHLIESKLKSTGAEYTTLQTFSFVAEA